MLRHIKTQANFKFREDQTSHSSHKPKSFLLLTDLFRIRIPHRFSHWFRKGIPRIQKTVGEKQVATGTEFNNCYPLCSLRHTLISQLTEPHSESVAVDITLMWQAPHHLSLSLHEIAVQPSHTLAGYWYLDDHTWVQQIICHHDTLSKCCLVGPCIQAFNYTPLCYQPSCIFWRKPISDRSALVLLEFQNLSQNQQTMHIMATVWRPWTHHDSHLDSHPSAGSISTTK